MTGQMARQVVKIKWIATVLSPRTSLLKRTSRPFWSTSVGSGTSRVFSDAAATPNKLPQQIKAAVRKSLRYLVSMAHVLFYSFFFAAALAGLAGAIRKTG